MPHPSRVSFRPCLAFWARPQWYRRGPSIARGAARRAGRPRAAAARGIHASDPPRGERISSQAQSLKEAPTKVERETPPSHREWKPPRDSHSSAHAALRLSQSSDSAQAGLSPRAGPQSWSADGRDATPFGSEPGVPRGSVDCWFTRLGVCGRVVYVRSGLFWSRCGHPIRIALLYILV
jgi:hypothetical protein